MNGFILIVPFLFIRFGILTKLNKTAVSRAAHFAPMAGGEIAAYYIYQISNIAIFIYLFFIKVIIGSFLSFYIGLGVYLLGLFLCTASVLYFASPSDSGFNFNGIYRFSRNPMYVSYFILLLGCAILTQSWILCGIVFVFQISSHWIILAEERWCMEKFGQEYRQYMMKVRRYI